MVLSSSTEKSGKIVVVRDVAAPYDRYILREIRAGAKAIVFLRDRTGVPGQTMYLVTGSDQGDLTVPCVEIFQPISDILDPLAKIIPLEGLEVSIWPERNRWKDANEKTAFQVIFNVVHSFMSFAVMLIGVYRLIQWWTPKDAVWWSIGPVCIILEIIGGAIRMAYTLIDPIWTFRLLPDGASVLLTLNLPFTFSSGILLSFFWAETLNANKVSASPFISDYKRSAIGLCVLLFIAEIITDSTRVVLPVTSFNPAYVSQGLYVLTSAILTVCYIVCAVKIRNKLAELSGRRRKIRNMTIRFVGSTAGYIAFCIFIIALIPLINQPWPFKLLLNGTVLAGNWWSLLQVYSFKATGKRMYSSSAARSRGENGGSGPPSPHFLGKSMRSDYSRYGPSAFPSAKPPNNDFVDTETTTSSSSSSSSYDDEEGQHQQQQGLDGTGNGSTTKITIPDYESNVTFTTSSSMGTLTPGTTRENIVYPASNESQTLNGDEQV
jgi:hypothetical protein